MSSRYLVIHRMEVQAANAMSAYWLANGAPVSATVLFIHGMGLKCDFVDEIQGVSLVHHDVQEQIETFESVSSTGKTRYDNTPIQRRGAAFIDGKDYSSKNKHSLSLQPTITRHMTVSLVVKYEDIDLDHGQIEAYLHSGRFAGGQIINYNGLHDLDSLEKVKCVLGSGFVVVERNDLLREHRSDPMKHAMKLVSNAYRDLVHFVKRELNEKQYKQIMTIINIAKETELDDLETKPLKEKIKALNLEQHITCVINDGLDYIEYQRRHTWLSLTMLGHQLLTEPKTRENVRGNYEHAFSEPVVGLIQYKSLKEIEVSEFNHLFWGHSWQSPTLFVFKQAGA